jgi:hypothetical protein
MACRPTPDPSFLRGLRLVSPRLELEWDHKEVMFNIYELVGSKRYWVHKFPPWMQDNRTINLLRMNNMWNEDTYASLREQQERRRVQDKYSAEVQMRDKVTEQAQDLDNHIDVPKQGFPGETRLKSYKETMENTWDNIEAAEEPDGDDW